MYSENHLVCEMRRASLGAEEAAFLIDGDTGAVTTYGQFFARAEQMAKALVSMGVVPGDRVAVQAPKTQEMVALYMAVVMAGGVFLPLNIGYTPAEVSYFVEDAAPRVLVCDPANQAALAEVAAAHGVEHVLTLDAGGQGTLAEATDANEPGFDPVPRGPDDLAAILYTSGTTGRSKGAMLSHEALASNARTLKDYWQFTAQDVLIHALPIFHTHGLFVALNISLVAGSACIFMPAFDADKIIGHMSQATALMGVPTFYVRLLDHSDLAIVARDMRLFVSGSAPLLAETHVQWQQVTGHAILERYGMTETNMNTSNPYAGERRPGTVGFPLPDVDLVVTDPETGTPVQEGEIGMIEVRGPNVFSGYWQMPDKTAAELRDTGFFITGDLGRIDRDGYVHIVGRQKDLIISGGFNIYPKEIELVIDDLPGVLESAVIGVPHPDFGEAVVAVVVPEAGAALTSSAVTEGVQDTLARFKQPKAVQLVEALPRNTMGKVQKKALRDTYAQLFAART